MDLVFAVDSSNLGNISWTQLTTFLQNIIRKLPVGPNGVRVGAVVFSDTGSIVYRLDQLKDQKSTVQAMANLPYQGGRAMSKPVT